MLGPGSDKVRLDRGNARLHIAFGRSRHAFVASGFILHCNRSLHFKESRKDLVISQAPARISPALDALSTKAASPPIHDGAFVPKTCVLSSLRPARTVIAMTMKAAISSALVFIALR